MWGFVEGRTSGLGKVCGWEIVGNRDEDGTINRCGEYVIQVPDK